MQWRQRKGRGGGWEGGSTTAVWRAGGGAEWKWKWRLRGDERDEGGEGDAAEGHEEDAADEGGGRAGEGDGKQPNRVDSATRLHRRAEAEPRDESGGRDANHEPDEDEDRRGVLRPPLEEMVGVVSELRVDAHIAQPEQRKRGRRAAQQRRAAKEAPQRAYKGGGGSG